MIDVEVAVPESVRSDRFDAPARTRGGRGPGTGA